MYDCQDDSYTDFSFAEFDTVGSSRPLCGSLTASPLQPDDTLPLSDLALFASQQGYLTQRHGHDLIICEINLADALMVNNRFGRQLIISCDLRSDPPAQFD